MHFKFVRGHNAVFLGQIVKKTPLLFQNLKPAFLKKEIDGAYQKTCQNISQKRTDKMGIYHKNESCDYGQGIGTLFSISQENYAHEAYEDISIYKPYVHKRNISKNWGAL